MQCDPIGNFGVMQAVSINKPLIDCGKAISQSGGNEEFVESGFQLRMSSTHVGESLMTTDFQPVAAQSRATKKLGCRANT